ncbi:MAG: tyrS [Candidatus Saccharibacteria bacterium]|nr:tyrS [Candidatus Saccharibacteria bacterium]
MDSMTLSEELAWRGFLNQTTLPKLSAIDENKLKFYHGYDASSDSLTVGNLAAVMLDKLLMKHGHTGIVLLGGATSVIGDPGGKDAERQLQSEATVAHNIKQVAHQLEKLVGSSVSVVNNADWLGKMSVLHFLRDVGKHFSMTPLVQRDYIAKRMGEGGAGISFTEFSYTLLQGYDFLYLHQKHGVNLQVSGADQWGNSLSGVELIRKVTGAEAHVLTMPLVINKATGKKFGKSEDGAIWLDPAKTSVYQFYQFWLNTDDESVADYLKIFTQLDKPQIAHIMTRFEEDKSDRLAQKTLAHEVTKLVHGPENAQIIKKVTETLFGNDDYTQLTAKDFQLLSSELPKVTAKLNHSPLVDVLVEAGLASSNGEARRFLNDNAIYINGQQFSSTKSVFDSQDVIYGHAIIRRGKNQNAVVELS